jgi:glycerol-1-phosphate dehydrogenase [NAD(P)+]
VDHNDVNALAGLHLSCSCGRTHDVPIKKIFTGSGALSRLPEVLADFEGAHAFVVGDKNTLPLALDRTLSALEGARCTHEVYEFKCGNKHLILDEELIGRMLVHMPPETTLLIAIGSGTMNDLTRVIAAKLGIPYIIIGTAPSMDGYASSNSSVTMDGGKKSLQLDIVPYAIIADSDILKDAPAVMISSGVGDILGKYVALYDWKLAQREKGAHFCPHIAELVKTAVDRCVESIPKLIERDVDAMTSMADALIMSGVCICMHGDSRPASGCEHHLSHFWEVALHGGEKDSPLHGNLVGQGTKVACRMYQMAAEEYNLDFPYYLPTPQEIDDYIHQLGDYGTLETLGVTKDLFYESFFHKANDRYNLMFLLEDDGKLESYARRLTDEFFPGK